MCARLVRRVSSNYYLQKGCRCVRELGQLLVKCEKCGALYPSGIVSDLETVLRDPKASKEVMTPCSFCKHENFTKITDMTYTVLT